VENNIQNDGIVEVEQNKNFFQAVGHFFVRLFKNSTFRYILKRILSSFITLLLLVAIVTALIRLIPDAKLYDYAVMQKLKAQAGEAAANRYFIVQMFKYGRMTIDGRKISVVENIFQYIYYILPIYKTIPYAWDNRYQSVKASWSGFIYLGRSIEESEFVTTIVSERMGISFRISIITVVLTYIVSFPLGVAMAKKPGGIVDKIGSVFIVLNYAIPALVFYLLMNSVFGDKNGAFGAFDFGFFYEEGKPQTLVVPIFCMVFLSIPGIIIWVRRFMVDELNSDYVKFARSKGLSENRIMYTHVLRNACVPLVRNIPATFIGAIVGSYFVEQIWGIPGTGRLLISSLNKLDVSAIQGLTVLYAAMAMISFLLGDIITVFFDPRIKLVSE
jgi:ABC-type dipeptide/oligopeptide/nickel transport system permease component